MFTRLIGPEGDLRRRRKLPKGEIAKIQKARILNIWPGYRCVKRFRVHFPTSSWCEDNEYTVCFCATIFQEFIKNFSRSQKQNHVSWEHLEIAGRYTFFSPDLDFRFHTKQQPLIRCSLISALPSSTVKCKTRDSFKKAKIWSNAHNYYESADRDHLNDPIQKLCVFERKDIEKDRNSGRELLKKIPTCA